MSGISWYSDSDSVAFWPGSINVRTISLGASSDNFNINTMMNRARGDWGRALGVSISSTDVRRNAQIVAYGGTQEEIERQLEDQRGRIGPNLAGRSRAATETYVRSINTRSGSRRVYRLSGYSRLFVLDRENSSHNRYQMVTTHELGHSLGHRGHSAHNHAVMHQHTHNDPTLKDCEIKHMRQIYDAFR